MELRHHRHRDGLTHDYSSPSLPRSKNTSAEVRIFQKAQQPHSDQLQKPNRTSSSSSSSSSLIIGYVKSGDPRRALDVYQQHMASCSPPPPHLDDDDDSHVHDLSPPAFVSLLKACAKLRDLKLGSEIHAFINRDRGELENNVFIGSTLVDMYAKCGSISKARVVFDMLPFRNVVTWNALIMGYVKAGLGREAIICFDDLQEEGISPNLATFISVSKACINCGDVDVAQRIFVEIAEQGLESDLLAGSAFIDMFAKLGLLEKSQGVFNKLPVKDVVSWTSLIAGYAEHGNSEEALKLLYQMQLEGIHPNSITYTCALKACGNLQSIQKGRELHSEIARKGMLDKDIELDNALVDMYMKCGFLENAREVFDGISVPDVVSWNILIVGYTEHESGEEALRCLDQMQYDGLTPDPITFVSALKACANINDVMKGAQIHEEVAKQGLLEKNLVVGNTLIDMYGKCGLPGKAQNVFNMLPVRNIISWTALMSGYVDQHYDREVLYWFYKMQEEGLIPDAAAFSCGLKACGSLGAICKGQEIHLEIMKKGLEIENLIGSILVYMYTKCHALVEAQDVFDKLPVQDVVSWTCLITGYTENGQAGKALNCLEKLQLAGLIPNAVTYLCSLKACGYVGAVEKGKNIHADIVQRTSLERDLVVGIALIDMYAKCGLLANALEVFERLPERDIVSWNALATGYALLGESRKVFHVVDRMLEESEVPNPVTFISVLNACTHQGLVNKGRTYFEYMSGYYDIIPNQEHFTCIIDLLGRTGQLDEAIGIVKKMTVEPDVVMWHTVLSACQKWGHSDLGRVAFECAVHLDEKSAAAYVCMSNIYADVSLQKEIKNVEISTCMDQTWKGKRHTG